jgi:hypothetical protein
MGTEEMKSKEQQTPTNERLNPHISGLAGIKNKGRERERAKNRIHTLSTISSWNGRRSKERRYYPTIQTYS